MRWSVLVLVGCQAVSGKTTEDGGVPATDGVPLGCYHGEGFQLQ